MKNVLIISYFFPPLGGPGVQRVSKFVKYLPENGWQPIVLTVKDIEYIAYDPSLKKEVDKVKIYRTESLDPMRLLFLYRKFFKKNTKTRLYNTLSQTKRNYWRDFFFIDPKIGWIPFAIKQGIRICRSQKIDMIYATIGPYSSALVALKISSICNIPFILDYRDLWQGKPDISYATKLHYHISFNAEKKSLNGADHIIINTYSARRKLHSIFPKLPETKTSVLYNGYDSRDFRDIQSKKATKKLFVYTGGFYGERTPKFFLQAIRELLNEGKIDFSFQFYFVGNLVQTMQREFDQFRLNKIVAHISQVNHQESIDYLFQAEFLLLFIAKKASEIVIPAKLFEYFAVKKPILAMIPPGGEAAELIRKYNAGIICEIDDVEMIKHNLLSLINSDRSQYYTELPNFERSLQTKQLARIFDEYKKS